MCNCVIPRDDEIDDDDYDDDYDDDDEFYDYGYPTNLDYFPSDRVDY